MGCMEWLTVAISIMDVVGRRSYHCDILFRVIDIREEDGRKIAILYGEDFRLIADAPYEDLISIDQTERMKKSQQFRSMEEQSFQLFRQDVSLIKQKQEYDATEGYSKELNYFQMPGKVLHMDGDATYLKNVFCYMRRSEFLFMGFTVMKKKCQQRLDNFSIIIVLTF